MRCVLITVWRPLSYTHLFSIGYQAGENHGAHQQRVEPQPLGFGAEDERLGHATTVGGRLLGRLGTRRCFRAYCDLQNMARPAFWMIFKLRFVQLIILRESLQAEL